MRAALRNGGVIGIALYCLVPFYWMVVSSFRRTSDIYDKSPLPTPWSMESYAAVFDEGIGFGQSLVNSLIVAGVTTAATMLIGTMAAYALARLTFRGKNVILALVIAVSMFPGALLIVPLLKLFTSIGWINSYQAMIVPSMSFALPLTVWNLTSFFRQLPYELEQSAMIDGCTPLAAFRRIMLPLAAPGIFTTAILAFIATWNEFIIAVTMVNDQSRQTATVRIAQFTGAAKFDTPFGTQMAASVLVTVPLVILVLFCQRRIVAGLTAGALK
ncbi:multiple sugar transport system permease protein [Streptosporangium album]|uniref:Multiple sugar transport system permease protein n=1 Tax=Streptosporangium album TaxID=47479 RepID=A0A7W7WCG3_9ACTN|nr:carbohydrate ABC transporter permease [Streptosporangium album]MBB4941818.1 multiple sugar transport system permease protein [Streptosporangium album]